MNRTNAKEGSKDACSALPKYLSNIDIEESHYLENLQEQLAKSDLCVEFNQALKKLRHALHNNYLAFDNSPEQSFAKEVIYRVMEESLAYIADLHQGTIFAANHHIRALLELYAIVEYVFSKAGKDKKFLNRFHLFPQIAFHKVFHQFDDAFLKLSEDLRKDFFSEYGELSPEIFEAFSTNNQEKLLKLRTWQGNATIENLFEMCPNPEVIKSDYAKLCLFTHVSSICRRSQLEAFPRFSQNTEMMLLITVRYAVFSYVCFKQEGLLDFVLQDKLDDIFLPLADVLTKSHIVRGYALGSK